MTTREQIVQAIKNTFQLPDNEVDLKKFSNSSRAQLIVDLPNLLVLLCDESASEKSIQEKLEDIIVQIKLKVEPRPLENIFKEQITKQVYDPLYVSKQNSLNL